MCLKTLKSKFFLLNKPERIEPLETSYFDNWWIWLQSINVLLMRSIQTATYFIRDNHCKMFIQTCWDNVLTIGSAINTFRKSDRGF